VILEGRDALNIGLIKRIGDRSTTEIWTQNWLPRDERMRPVAPKEEEGAPWLVSDLIDSQTRSWNQQKLETFFYPMDVEVICNIPLSHRNQTDFWAWHWERTGTFSVRSCYRALAGIKRTREDWLDERAASSSDDSKLWTKLWKIMVPSKIRHFLWRLAQHSLPTGDVRQ
jgi:hypothetical protein